MHDKHGLSEREVMILSLCLPGLIMDKIDNMKNLNLAIKCRTLLQFLLQKRFHQHYGHWDPYVTMVLGILPKSNVN